MERLTFEGNFCEIALCLKTPGGSYCENGMCSQRKVWERLKAYEDTSLTPEECARAVEMEDILADEYYSVDRMVELMRADKDGRLVVLPCKVGDTVYFAAWFGTDPHIVKRIIEPYFYTDDARGHGSTAEFFLRDFGKSVFLTREEAEAALMEAKKDG